MLIGALTLNEGRGVNPGDTRITIDTDYGQTTRSTKAGA